VAIHPRHAIQQKDMPVNPVISTLRTCQTFIPKGVSMKHACVYIMASAPNGTLYVGVTSQPVTRVWQHKNGSLGGFTSRYRVHQLVWYEMHEDMTSAIAREKQLKAGSRLKKILLIEALNPSWQDLYATIL
jgi:putative endonuclease